MHYDPKENGKKKFELLTTASWGVVPSVVKKVCLSDQSSKPQGLSASFGQRKVI